MEDPKTATHIEEVELLRLQLVSERIAGLDKERQTMVKALLDKYGAFQSIGDGGMIVRPPAPLQSVPEDKGA